MLLNESMYMLIEEAVESVAIVNLPFILKLFIIFGAIYLFRVVIKTGDSLIIALFYVIGLVKWFIYKIMKKDI